MRLNQSIPLALALCGVSALAQDGPYLALGLTGAQGNAATMTRQIWSGYTLEGGYTLTSKEFGYTVRPYGSFVSLPGKKSIDDRNTATLWGPNTYDMQQLKVGLDLIYKPSDTLPIQLFFGPSLGGWHVKQVGSGTSIGSPHLRAGLRLGAEWDFGNHWGASFCFTQTEWQSTTDGTKLAGYIDDTKTPRNIDGLNPSKPAYMNLMVNYRF